MLAIILINMVDRSKEVTNLIFKTKGVDNKIFKSAMLLNHPGHRLTKPS